MPVGVLDSPSMKSGFITPEMERVWEEPATIQGWFSVEAALARVQARLGIIPADAAEAVEQAAAVTDGDVAAIGAVTSGHPFVPALDRLRIKVAVEHRRWVHFGATTQDILDTGRVLQIRQALALVDRRIDELLSAVGRVARDESDTLMALRTNGQLAVPGTLGLRAARWLAELRRGRARLEDEASRVLMAQFSGAAGTYAAFGEHGTAIAEGVAADLDLAYEPVAWHSSRDSYTALVSQLAVLARSASKIADDLFEMQRTDLGEAWKEMDVHTSGSTTMPQKRNPFATLAVTECGRLAVGSAVTLLVQPPDLLERDPRQFEVERDVLPRVFAFTDRALAGLADLLPRIRFDRERLAANAAAEGPLIVTEGIMMRFAPILGHETAHDVLQEFAAEYRTTGTGLRAFVAARPEIAERLREIDLDELEQPAWYTGLSAQIAREAAADV